MGWYLQVLKRYAEFGGRSQRSEIWYFILFSTIISIVLNIIDVSAGLYDYEIGAGLLSGLYGLAVLIPGIAVSIRRLHDTGRSGWWYLIIFVPIAGIIVLIVFFVKDSQPGPNQWGPNPKEVAGVAT